MSHEEADSGDAAAVDRHGVAEGDPGTADVHHEAAGHGPATADWPRGFGEASWWPFLSAAGVTALYVGAGLTLLAGEFGGTIGPAVVVAGAGAFVAGLYGWLYDAFVRHYGEGDPGDGGVGLRWGMVLFLGSELATFGAGFVYYFFVRAGTWPPEGAELPELLSSLILVNTLVLVASSATLHVADVRLRGGDRDAFVRWLGVTLLLGVVFLGGQVLEYYEFVVGEGFTLTSGVFASAFFGLTGLHGLHVTLGVVLLAILFARALYGQYSASRHVSVTTVSMYWHFVDAVWLFLVVTIYVGGAVGAQV